MRVSRNRPVEALARSSVVTIGNFDGVHLGHRALIDRCRSLAAANDTVTVITFEPLPRAFFDPNNAPPRLTPPVDKLRLLGEAGAELVWMMRFDWALARLAAEDFVRQVLVESLGARHVVTGENFRFGHRREGGLPLMRELGARFGFVSHTHETVMLDDQRVSSGGVRQAVAAGQFEAAAQMLSRPFAICGRVRGGRRLGRELGYPTANVKIRALPCPLKGIFAVRARVQGGAWQPGVASLGWRPMFGGGEMLLEVHLFDFDADLYGRRLETQFVAKLRDEACFPTVDDMVRQMREDEAQAKDVLSTETWISDKWTTKTP